MKAETGIRGEAEVLRSSQKVSEGPRESPKDLLRPPIHSGSPEIIQILRTRRHSEQLWDAALGSKVARIGVFFEEYSNPGEFK